MSKVISTPGKSRFMLFSAVLTWFAVLLSESFRHGEELESFAYYSAALVFLLCFILEERRNHSGWSWQLVLMTVASASLVGIGGFGLTPALYVIVGTQLFEKVTRRDFWIVTLLLNALLLAKLRMSGDWIWTLSAFCAYAGFQIFGQQMSSASQALARANDELKRFNAELISTRALLAESTRVQERLRLSRELHDVCGHKLTALKLTLRCGSESAALSAADRKLCQNLADELLQDVRSVVAQLREHDGIDLAIALNQLGTQWQQPKVKVDIAPDARAPSMRHAQVLLRVAQEALTNASRHAKASFVDISLKRDEQDLTLTISDNGQGATNFSAGNGLTGMRERLAEIGGQLFIASRPADSDTTGFWVQARLPILGGATDL